MYDILAFPYQLANECGIVLWECPQLRQLHQRMKKNARLVLQIHIRISLHCVVGWAFNGAHMIADWLEAIPLSSTARTARPTTATARGFLLSSPATRPLFFISISACEAANEAKYEFRSEAMLLRSFFHFHRIVFRM